LGLGYPGGPWIDALAPRGNPRAVPFTFGQIKPRIYRDGTAPANKKAPINTEGPHFDFSFSGIKTAVLRHVETHHLRESIEARRAALAAGPSITPKNAAHLCDQQALDLIASFQYAVVGNLQRQTFAAAEAFGAHSIVVSGGVAANSELRRRFQAEADRRGLPIAFPSLALSTDNAAMIAAAAWPKLVAQDFAAEDLGATPQLRLGQQ
ncbi:MAG TPA: hypothetical protein VK813_06515, partial [Edaphobacter sp.]|nr:hypothetical protein [Edaphobacter sp.]